MRFKPLNFYAGIVEYLHMDLHESFRSVCLFVWNGCEIVVKLFGCITSKETVKGGIGCRNVSPFNSVLWFVDLAAQYGLIFRIFFLLSCSSCQQIADVRCLVTLLCISTYIVRSQIRMDKISIKKFNFLSWVSIYILKISKTDVKV